MKNSVNTFLKIAIVYLTLIFIATSCKSLNVQVGYDPIYEDENYVVVSDDINVQVLNEFQFRNKLRTDIGFRLDFAQYALSQPRSFDWNNRLLGRQYDSRWNPYYWNRDQMWNDWAWGYTGWNSWGSPHRWSPFGYDRWGYGIHYGWNNHGWGYNNWMGNVHYGNGYWNNWGWNNYYGQNWRRGNTSYIYGRRGSNLSGRQINRRVQGSSRIRTNTRPRNTIIVKETNINNTRPRIVKDKPVIKNNTRPLIRNNNTRPRNNTRPVIRNNNTRPTYNNSRPSTNTRPSINNNNNTRPRTTNGNRSNSRGGSGTSRR